MLEDFPRPWLAFSDGLPAEIEIPEQTLSQAVEAAASQYPGNIAIEFLGTTFTYTRLLKLLGQCAQAFLKLGVREGDSVLLSMPNIPNAVIALYALNKIGARICMTHPLSSKGELRHYVNQTGSRVVLTIDLFYDRFAEMLDDHTIDKLIVAKISDYLPYSKAALFMVTKGRKIQKVPVRPQILEWREFLTSGKGETQKLPTVNPHTCSVVLFSGGTTSLPKGIELSSYNFEALTVGTEAISRAVPGDSILAILPIFHGFGLGLCVHACLSRGLTVILIPEFNTKNYIDSLIKYKPSFIAGVPTLFEALMRNKKFAKVRFDHLKAAYCGGDSLYPGIKHRFDEMIMAQGSKVELKEGYGLTETVTACIISPDLYKESAMGVPLPNMVAKIVVPDTHEEVPVGEEGEICVSGPQVMLGYLNDPEATKQALHIHKDGGLWLHTGDIGYMDENGYFFFKSRIKRILKVSGISVYPVQIEQVLESHPLVFKACVIGIPDDYQMTCVKAFVVIDPSRPITKTEPEIKNELIEYCKKNLIKWSVPRDIEFRTSLPSTLIGKVSYTALEQEELQKACSTAAAAVESQA